MFKSYINNYQAFKQLLYTFNKKQTIMLCYDILIVLNEVYLQKIWSPLHFIRYYKIDYGFMTIDKKEKLI